MEPHRLNQPVSAFEPKTTVGIGVVSLVAASWLLAAPVDLRAQSRRPPNANDSPSGGVAVFDGKRAWMDLDHICRLGRRPSGSVGMARQRRLLHDHFTKLGADVGFQQFDIRHPENGRVVRLANLIVQWNPKSIRRILLCCHYDTRPFPDEDRRRPRGVFVGANDGASGVALLMELGRLMPSLKCRYGVDFVFFDAEEFVFDKQRDPLFLGSTHFARNHAAHPPPYHYRWGVLLDMIGDADLQIYKERNSVKFARPLVNDIWRVAEKLGVKEFHSKIKYEIRDDHLPLNKIARIPTCDIIDFDYPRPGWGPKYWHTEADTADKCSSASLKKVGDVIHAWLGQVR